MYENEEIESADAGTLRLMVRNLQAAVVPSVTSGMKARFIGEFYWKEDAPYYDEDGEAVEHTAKRVVPWNLCKRIYKEMASFSICDAGKKSRVALEDIYDLAEKPKAVCTVAGSGVSWLPGAGSLPYGTTLYTAPPTPDATRLDFMLQNCRKVACETMPPFGSDRHEVYVEEGFMSDKKYPVVPFTGKWQQGTPESLAVQRAAIDVALAAHKQEGK